VHAGKLGHVINFRPTIVGGTAKHCIEQYMVLFCYCSLGGNTAMVGRLHARLCHVFLVLALFFSWCCSARYLYWAAKDIPDNPSKRINNVEFLYERQFHPNVGNAVMATSYALLCYLAHNDMTDSVPIMKFISSQRNHLMGWSSTSVRSLPTCF